jgi:hypothetical protein
MKDIQKALPYDIAKEGLDEQGREKGLGKTSGAQEMSDSGKRWTVQDRYGNSIYLTQERWEHIIDDANHPEMDAYEEYLKTTIKKGRRRQEPLNPRKYRYYHLFGDLPDDVNHVVAIISFGFDVEEDGQTTPQNFVATAFFKHIRLME